MIALLLAVGLGGALAAQEAPAPPTLDDVLASVETHFPLLLAAEAEVEAARAEQMAAAGGFDPVLGAAGWVRTGPYEQQAIDVGLTQATPLWGLEVSAGYRVGLGSFAAYDGWYDTLDLGEVYADLRLPLLKDGFTDARRTSIVAARQKVAAQGAKAEGKAVAYALQARMAWFAWLAAGEQRRIAERLRDTAQRTFEAAEIRVARGDLAEIGLVDARRVLVEREGKLLETELKVQTSATKLGLYLRGPDGRPTPPLEVDPPALDPVDTPLDGDVEDWIHTAQQTRPDVRAVAAERAAVDAERRLAQIGVLPKLDLKVRLAQDFQGATDTKSEPFDAKVGGELSLPLALRTGRGKLAKATARRDALDAELRYVQDVVEADIRAAHATVLTLHERARLADENAALTRDLEEATRRRYELGDADLFDVYLREQSTLSAETSRIVAWQAVHVAEAELLTALGRVR